MPTDAVQDFISRLLARERVSARDPEGEERSDPWADDGGQREPREWHRETPRTGDIKDPVTDYHGWYWTKDGGWGLDLERALREERQWGRRGKRTRYEDLRFDPPEYPMPVYGGSLGAEGVDFPPEMPWLDPTLEPRGTWHPPHEIQWGRPGNAKRDADR